MKKRPNGGDWGYTGSWPGRENMDDGLTSRWLVRRQFHNISIARWAALLLTGCGLCYAADSAADWERLQTMSSQERIRVYRAGSNAVDGSLQNCTPEGLLVEAKQGTVQIAKAEVRKVVVLRKSSRKRSALIGAAVGFAIGFPIGWLTAGRVGDVNNPRVSQRLENVARFGPFGAGVGALIATLAPGTKQILVYQATAK